MVRGILGIVAGLIGVAVVMMLVSFIGSFFIPATAADTSSVDAIKATYEGLGTHARWMVIASWFFGVLAGAAIAKTIVGRPWAAWTIAGLFEAYLLLSVMMLPMPGWMQVSALIAPLLAGFIANHLVRNRTVVRDEVSGTETRTDEEV